jgi:osmoprotectant transport system substrate-binding protein
MIFRPSMPASARKPGARRPLAVVPIVIAMACAGCGSTATSTPPASSPTHTSSTTAAQTTPTTSTSTSTSTATAISTSAPTPPGALPGTGKPPVTIGDKNFTEQFVLGELYQQALQAQGFTVGLNRNIGPTDVTLQALKTGALAMYPEYLNVFATAIAHDSRRFRSRAAAYGAAQHYAQTHGLQLLAPTPFADTDAIGVTVGYAQVNHLRTLRDLGKVASALTVGGPPQFQQGDPGLATVERRYGFTAAGYKTLAVGDQYTALNSGAVQAADVNTTDGALASGNYEPLRDPDHLFGWGNAVPVVTARVLDAEGPAFADTIDRISALLTIPVMRQLNQAVDVAGQDPATVAKQFLETHGVIPPGPQ